MKKNQCYCQICGNPINDGQKVECSQVMRTGDRFQYVHFECLHTENKRIKGLTQKGTHKKHNKSYQVEFSLKSRTVQSGVEFGKNNFVAIDIAKDYTSYKTQRLNGLNTLSKNCDTINLLIEKKAIELENGKNSILKIFNQDLNKNDYQVIKEFYHELFNNLLDTILKNNKLTSQEIKLNKLEFASIENNYIQFNILQLLEGKEFMKVIKFYDKVLDTVKKNFVEHYNDEPKDKRRYPTKEDYRVHKAKITSDKLVKIYNEL